MSLNRGAPAALTLVLFTLIAIVPPPDAAALVQTHTLSGDVVNEKAEHAVGAVCTLNGRALPEDGLSVKTDEREEYQFPNLPPGTYDLARAAAGYQPIMQKRLDGTGTDAPAGQAVLPAG